MSDEECSTSDRGDTFIEVLVATAVLSIGISALMFGLGTSITTSITNRSQSEALTALNSAAEYVKSMPQAAACATTAESPVPAGEVSPPAGFTLWYGPATALGSEPCAAVTKMPVRVEGEGFQTAHLILVKRG